MGDVCGSSGVGSGTHTCLVGVQAALDALHQAGTGEAAEDGLEVEGTVEDSTQDGRQLADVHEHDDQSNGNVDDAHDGDHEASDLHQTLAAAHDADGEQDGQDSADEDGGGGFVVEAEAGEGGLQVVGGQCIVAHCVGQDDDDGKDNAQPALTQCGLHVVGGAAVAGAVGGTALVDLCQGGFHISGSAAQNGGHPHPEHGTGAAQADRGGDAHDVAGTNAGSGGDQQSTQGGGCALSLGLFHDDPECFGQQADLDQFGAEGEEQASHNQEHGNPGIVQEPADGIDNAVNACEDIAHFLFTLSLI